MTTLHLSPRTRAVLGVAATVMSLGLIWGLITLLAGRGPDEPHAGPTDVPAAAPPAPAVPNHDRELRTLAVQAAQPDPAGAAAFDTFCRAATADWNGFVEATGDLTGRPADVVARVIARQGRPGLPRLVAAVREGRIAVPIATAAVTHLGPDAVREVAALAADPSAPVRLWVAASLGGFPEQAVQHLPVLGEFLKDSDERVAVQALNTIRPLGTAARPLAGAVKTATADARERVRAAALVVLPGLSDGPDEELQRKLVAEATDPGAPLRTRLAAIESLGRTRASPETLAVLLAVASDSDRVLRSAALDSLIKLGRGATPIAAQVLKLLASGRHQGPDAARLLQVLVAVDPPRDFEEVAVKYCSGNSAPERAAALACLLRVPKPSDATLRAAMERLSDSDTGVRMKAVQLLIPHAERADIGAALRAAREREPNPHIQRLLAAVADKTPRAP